MKSLILAALLSLELALPTWTLTARPAEIYDEIPDGYGVIIDTGDVYDVRAEGYTVGERVTVLMFDPGTPADMTDDAVVWIW